MDLSSYIDSLRGQLAGAAELGGEDARALAERLTGPLESAFRLALLDALSTAAGEITRDLAPGSVELRLRGQEPSFVVTLPATTAPDADTGSSSTSAPPAVADVEESAMSRINFRLPDHLKGQIEEAAGRESLSVNTWLVRITAAAVRAQHPTRPPGRSGTPGGQRLTGWVR
jgi:hypothetical protein